MRPWGTVVYSSTIEQLQNDDLKAKFNRYNQHLEDAVKKETNTLYGFLFSFMVIIVVYSLYFVVTIVIIVVNFCLVLLYKHGAMM